MRPSEKYVMKPFKSDKKVDAKRMIDRAADAIENIITRI